MTSKMIEETNQHRKSHGLGELSLDNDLQSKAQAYADEMKSYNTSNFSDKPINYHHQQGIDHYENIMWAHNMQLGSIDPFENWKNSAAHNRAMLADVHRIGVGVERRMPVGLFTVFWTRRSLLSRGVGLML